MLGISREKFVENNILGNRPLYETQIIWILLWNLALNSDLAYKFPIVHLKYMNQLIGNFWKASLFMVT